MNEFEIVSKYKLWKSLSNAKVSLREDLIDYVFSNAKTKIIEENRDFFTDEILQDFFKKTTTYSYYPKEKKMFDFLVGELSKDFINEFFKESNNNYILSSWMERNKNTKVPNFKMLSFLNKESLNDGTFLYLASKCNNSNIFNFALDVSNFYIYKFNVSTESKSSFSINLLEYHCDEKYKIQMVKKFKKQINQESASKILLKSLVLNQKDLSDFMVSDFFQGQSDVLKLGELKYNQTVRFFINKYPNLIEKDYLTSLFIQSSLNYIDEDTEKYKETMQQLKEWNLTDIWEIFNYFKKNLKKNNKELCSLILDQFEKEFKSLSLDYKLSELYKHTYNDTLVYFIDSRPDLFLKNNQGHHDFIKNTILEVGDNLKDIQQFLNKLTEWNISLDQSESVLTLSQVLNKNNIEVLFHSPVFKFNNKKLLSNIWKNDTDVTKKLIKLLKKEDVIEFWGSLHEYNQKQFSVIYLETFLKESPKIKTLKI